MFRDDALKHSFDLVMIPGGDTGPLLDTKNHPQEVKYLRDWVRVMDKRVKIMASVCTGAAVLAYSGLLDGKPAATNHAAFAWVTPFGPGFCGTTFRAGSMGPLRDFSWSLRGNRPGVSFGCATGGTGRG